MKTLSPIVPEPNPCAHFSVVRFPESHGRPPVPAVPPLPMNTPQQVAAPVAIPFPSQGDGEQRSPGISLADGVNQFLYIYEDVIVAAGTLRAILNFFEKKIPALRHPSLQEWMGRQEEELRAIAGDIADVCNDLIPGAPAAFGLEVQFLNPFEPFPLPGGSDQTNKVSQKLTPVPPEWMSSRQK